MGISYFLVGERELVTEEVGWCSVFSVFESATAACCILRGCSVQVVSTE